MNGRVFLVGAGPGDPGLLTARALELIARADTILYDRLIPAEALEGARTDAELLFVGKQGGGESDGSGEKGALGVGDFGKGGGGRLRSVPVSASRSRSEALLVEHARAGKMVVRLKGGDPFVFGRGGEEALHAARGGHPSRSCRDHRGRGRRRLRGSPRHAAEDSQPPWH